MQPIYLFGDVKVLGAERRLVVSGREASVGARAFDLLVALIERRDRVVSKEELLTVVWPGLVVEEANIQVQISALRKFVGHSAIATVAGRGYRFCASLRDDLSAMQSAVPDGEPKSEITDGREGLRESNGSELLARPEPTAGRGLEPSRRATVIHGRGDDISAINRLLQMHCLVTITGAGGIGKTHLAKALSEGAGACFPGGVFWVGLGALNHDELIGSAVAGAIGIALGEERRAVNSLARVLRTKKSLLVLDNCEHLLEGVARLVAELAAAAPDLRILATSQVPLRIGGESVYRLGTLSLPMRADVASIAASGAGELFVDRATAVESHFELRDDNAAGVAEICRRLDGIPLAIELAAARMPLLGVEGIRSRLSDRFRMLVGGSRGVLPRHRTLRAALEWSHSLLTASEQVVFRRLSVFAGGFTLESAQYLAQDGQTDTWRVLQHLGALVDKSLISVARQRIPRYSMLETTREFGLEMLTAAGEVDAMMRRHCEALLVLLKALDEPEKRHKSLPLDWAAAAIEIDNVRVALDWMLRRSTTDPRCLGLLGLSGYCFKYANLRAEAFERLITFRSLMDTASPKDAVARFWYALAEAGARSCRLESFEAALKAERLFEELSDDPRRYDVLALGIGIGARLGRRSEVARMVATAEAIESDQWAPRLRANFLVARHWWELFEGRHEEALESARQQARLIALSGAIGAAQLVEGSNVARCELALGRAEAAETRARTALNLFETGLSIGDGHILEALMLALIAQGRYEEALTAGRRAVDDLTANADEFRLLEPLARIAAEQGRFGDAALIVGYVDKVMFKTGEVRWSLMRSWRKQLDDLLSRALAPAELEFMRQAGRSLDPHQAFSHAFGDAAASTAASV